MHGRNHDLCNVQNVFNDFLLQKLTKGYKLVTAAVSVCRYCENQSNHLSGLDDTMDRKDISVHLDDSNYVVHLGDSLENEQYCWDKQRHCNADHELHVVLSGNCVLDVEGRRYSLSANKAVFIAPGQYHNPQEISDDFQKISVSLSISPGPGKKHFWDQISPCVLIDMPCAFATFAECLYQEIRCKSTFQNQMLHAFCEALVITLARTLEIPQWGKNTDVAADHRADVMDNFFVLPIGEDCTETNLAQKLYLSTRQLARVMQSYYGMSFREKLLRSRMEYAGWLLRTTNQTVTEICNAVGYKSESVFYQNFKKQYHVTPLQYRQVHNQAYSKENIYGTSQLGLDGG